MAEGIRNICDQCGKSIEAWSDGNPYYIDILSGKKEYAYHPDHEGLKLCIGNDSPHLCLNCGKKFKVDSRSPITKCPKCSSDKIMDTFLLSGHPCPYCKKGVFSLDPDWHAIS